MQFYNIIELCWIYLIKYWCLSVDI